MFSQFGGEMTQESKQLMIMLTGAGIAIIVITMAMYVIIRNTKEIRKIKKEQKQYG